jgi:hypothetical protein
MKIYPFACYVLIAIFMVIKIIKYPPAAFDKNNFCVVELLSTLQDLCFDLPPDAHCLRSTYLSYSLIEKLSMIRPMLPVIGAVLLCAQSLCALAADSAANSTAQVRQQIEAKRDQISGVSQVSPPAQQGATTVLDTSIDTLDAPSQVQQP